MTGGTAVTELDWLLENFTAPLGGVRYAVILSPDGLALGRSPGVTAEVAEHLAALVAGVQSLARFPVQDPATR
jgi:predicted regulator of Ras-like GTPase activity (Roadblock/LC7/MglB family)